MELKWHYAHQSVWVLAPTKIKNVILVRARPEGGQQNALEPASRFFHEKVDAMTDRQKLKQILRTVIRADSLEEVEKEITWN